MQDTKNSSFLTTRVERASYWSYFAGQSMSYTMLGGFMTSYLLLIGVDITKLALAMLIVKIWDAVNDTIFGVIFDKTNFKSGLKCIPWLRISAIVIPVATVLIYLIPAGINTTAKIVWFIVAYILWDAAYTLSDVPIYSLTTTMTDNIHERNKLLSHARIYALAAAFVLSMITTTLISEQVGMSFTSVAIIVSIIIGVTMAPVIFTAKERIPFSNESDTSYTMKGLLKYLRQNKYLLLYYSGYIVFGITATVGSLGLFVSYYLFGSALFAMILSLIQAVPMVIVTIVIHKVLLKVDKFKLFFYCNLAYALIGIFTYFAGYKNMTVYIILLVINSIPYATIYILNLTFTPDCVEYGRYKTGIDARGMAFAIQSFAAKFSSLAQPVALFILGLFGWLTVQAESFSELDRMVKSGIATQTPAAISGLWFTYTLVPALGALVSLILYSFYKLNDHDVQLMAKYNANEITREQAENEFKRKY